MKKLNIRAKMKMWYKENGGNQVKILNNLFQISPVEFGGLLTISVPQRSLQSSLSQLEDEIRNFCTYW